MLQRNRGSKDPPSFVTKSGQNRRSEGVLYGCYKMLRTLFVTFRNKIVLYGPKSTRQSGSPAIRTNRTNRGIPPQMCRANRTIGAISLRLVSTNVPTLVLPNRTYGTRGYIPCTYIGTAESDITGERWFTWNVAPSAILDGLRQSIVAGATCYSCGSHLGIGEGRLFGDYQRPEQPIYFNSLPVGSPFRLCYCIMD